MADWSDEMFVCVLPIDDPPLPELPPIELCYPCRVCGQVSHRLAGMYDELFYKCQSCGAAIAESRALTSPDLLHALLPSFWCIMGTDGSVVT